jgi:hypothetical protein
MTKIAGSWSESGPGSNSQRHEFADQDPHKNVTDPEHCFLQDKVLLEKLTQFITSLIENGNLGLARALRSQFILKYEERRTRLLPDFDLASMNSINRRCNLLNFKSTDLAEQMTLLGKWGPGQQLFRVKFAFCLTFQMHVHLNFMHS